MRAIILRLTFAFGAVLLVASASFAQARPDSPPGTVTLPLADYDKLVDRAAHPPAPPERSPVPAVVSRADLQVRLSAADLRGTATVQVEVLREGRVKVPLLEGATLIEVQQGTAAVPVVSEAGGTSAILSGPGSFTLAVSFGSEVTTEPGRASAVLPAVRAGTVRATIDAPGDNADVRVDRGLLGSRSSANGKTVVEVTLEPGVASRISWSSREQTVRAPRQARLVSNVETLATVGEGDIRLASLFDVNVLEGQPEQIDLQVPEGFDLVSVSGGTVESSGQQKTRVTLTVTEPARRGHQFLVTLERTVPAGTQHADLTIPGVLGAQRETGEIAWEAVGTVELSATQAAPLRRVDVTEVAPSLSSLARSPLLTAFRYQRRADERVGVAFDVRRFADAPVLGAAASDAQVTTLVSAEGRALTEFRLTVANRGQLFLKVGLPKGATLLSAEVGGQPVKPVDAPDGARVPLVRTGYQPSGAYPVSFVYVEAGTTFDKKGDSEMKLPRVDLPIALLNWEVFLPERFKVKRFDGDAIPAQLVAVSDASRMVTDQRAAARASVAAMLEGFGDIRDDQVAGIVVDDSGGLIPGAQVTLTDGRGRTTSVVSNGQGRFAFSGVTNWPVRLRAALQGFRPAEGGVPSGGSGPIALTLQVASMQETVTIQDFTPTMRQKAGQSQQAAPSENVQNLQRRVSGVLPVRIDIPRTGQSFSFVRPLVLDEETVLRFQYKEK